MLDEFKFKFSMFEGSLNAHTVYIVPKHRLLNSNQPASSKHNNKSQPFEATFRLQVRNFFNLIDLGWVRLMSRMWPIRCGYRAISCS